jgi:hypothetical protein
MSREQHPPRPASLRHETDKDAEKVVDSAEPEDIANEAVKMVIMKCFDAARKHLNDNCRKMTGNVTRVIIMCGVHPARDFRRSFQGDEEPIFVPNMSSRPSAFVLDKTSSGRHLLRRSAERFGCYQLH